jgi:hypothetical protein
MKVPDAGSRVVRPRNPGATVLSRDRRERSASGFDSLENSHRFALLIDNIANGRGNMVIAGEGNEIDHSDGFDPGGRPLPLVAAQKGVS